MGFDKDSTLPIIDPHKRTTKVNFSIVIGVIVFLIASAGVVIWYSNNPHTAAPKEEQTKAPAR
jgi:flagellar basal body-associated protein FliL